MTTMTTAVIDVRKIERDFQMGDSTVRALRDVSLRVDPGEYVAIIGPSGSGKTTLMNLIGCLDTPTSGEYFLDGEEVSLLDDDSLSHVRNEKIGFVFQTFNLLARTTALDNVALPLAYANVSRTERRAASKRALSLVCSIMMKQLLNQCDGPGMRLEQIRANEGLSLFVHAKSRSWVN